MREYLHDEYWNKAKLTRVDDLQGDSLQDKLEMGVVHTEFAEFASQVQKAFRGCKLRSHFLGDGVRVLEVYMEGDTFTMGSIRITSNDDGDTLYVVSSHKVRNNKHNGYSKEHRQCSTIRIKTAVKNAKKYLQRLTHVEMVKATSHRCYDKVEEFVSKQRDVMNQSFSMAFDTTITPTASSLPVYIKELFHLSDVGHS